MNEIALRMNGYLESRNISGRQAAIDMKIAPTTLNSFLSGKTSDTSASIITNFCRTYNLSADYILLGHEHAQYGDNTIISSPHSQQVNDTTFLDLSRGKQVQNNNGVQDDPERRRLIAQVMSQQKLIETLQISLDRLTQMNQVLTNKIVAL